MTNLVFVIDGDSEQCMFVCSSLQEKLGYSSIGFACSSGMIEYILAKKVIPDIILFDISKVENYCEVICNIKNLKPSIPVVVLTKCGDYGNSMAAITVGASDFITKPVAVERVSVTLGNILRLHKTKSIYNVFFSKDGNIRPLEEIENFAIDFAVKHYNGKMSEVAKRLKIGRSTLYRKISRLGLGGFELKDNRSMSLQ